ncbi:MAG TPA: pitrilysin family protein [Gemmatimonadales bacterium]|nr:pitrilysin family protein [Gemmatimonadales bacterium]
MSSPGSLIPTVAAALSFALVHHEATAQQPAARLAIPIEYYKLPNGMKVVLSRDTTTPTAIVAVYYNIGFRVEPKNRTGFAHLFEHLMFQGSQNLGKMEFIKLVEQNGGILNGSTRYDFTNYFQVVPSNALNTILWAEADRMRGLAIDTSNLKNQQEVVKNEVRVNVLNQPYGSFPWLDLPMRANTNWYNAHNFYGDLADLDAATLDDAAGFFRTYYAPSNAVLVVTGDFDPRETRSWIEQYFGPIASGPRPSMPDLTEPKQTKERRFSRTDSLATRPAIGIAYHVPERYTPEWYAFGVLDQILGQGRDSRFYEELVRKRGLTGDVSTGINWGLGSMYDYNGPMLWIIQVFHDSDKPAASLIEAFDASVEALRTTPVGRQELERSLVKLRSSFYSEVEAFAGFGRANLLASFALFDDDPARINRLEAEFAKVTPELILATAQEYLAPSNRTILTIVPGKKAAEAGSSESTD